MLSLVGSLDNVWFKIMYESARLQYMYRLRVEAGLYQEEYNPPEYTLSTLAII